MRMMLAMCVTAVNDVRKEENALLDGLTATCSVGSAGHKRCPSTYAGASPSIRVVLQSWYAIGANN